MKKSKLPVYSLVSLIAIITNSAAANNHLFQQAQQNAEQAQQAFRQSMDYVYGWLAHRDPKTGLIPRNLTQSFYWNAKDAAADNYPFMVLTATMLNPPLFEGVMKDMLYSEIHFTNRVGNLPDDYSFETHAFRSERPDMRALIFGGSEYVKDGLMPLTEWLGESPWSERMIGIMNEIWRYANVKTPYGVIPSTNQEINGEQLQVLARLYWMTGNEQYKDWAFRLADYYFYEQHPAKQESLQLDDHGCEIIGGLAGAYYLAAHVEPKRYEAYQEPLYRLLDVILEHGVNENGLLYHTINPINGAVLNDSLTDNWGYNYNAILNAAQLDAKAAYRQAVEQVLEQVINHVDYRWEGGSADGYADTIEGGLNLMNRIPSDNAAQWIDQSMAIMLNIQREDGIVEGWHGDGNFARTALMYALWKTQGVTLDRWRADLAYGAAREGETLFLSIQGDWPWYGKLIFDSERHEQHLNLPSDYPRINQFPEWYTVKQAQAYRVTIGDQAPKTVPGRVLLEGLPLTLDPNEPLSIHISRSP